MKLVVGLGNPGAKYNFTRHNFGFLALDFYLKVHGISWEAKPKFGAVWATMKTNATGAGDLAEDVIFIKPQDFYNESGRAVGEFMRYYKIKPLDILVICDNFDLEFGKIRYRASGVAGGNNGLKSVDAAVKGDYPRLRLGTGNDALRRQMGDVDFVLSRFTTEEKERLPEVLRAVAEKIDELV